MSKPLFVLYFYWRYFCFIISQLLAPWFDSHCTKTTLESINYGSIFEQFMVDGVGQSHSAKFSTNTWLGGSLSKTDTLDSLELHLLCIDEDDVLREEESTAEERDLAEVGRLSKHATF